MWVWIIISIIIFSIIVLVHEFGHFATARLFWVKVYEFGLWIPPRAKKLWTDKAWTLYSLNWLPIWWFVRLKWENASYYFIFDKNNKQYKQEDIKKLLEKDIDVYDKSWKVISKDEKKFILKEIKEAEWKDSLLSKSFWKKSIVVLAWVFMNFLLSIIILTILFTIWLKPVWINSEIETNLDIKVFPTLEKSIQIWLLKENPWIILFPMTWSIAQNAWINENDILLRVNWNNVKSSEEVKDLIWKSNWMSLNFEISRDDKIINIPLTVSEDWKIWSYLAPNLEYNRDFVYKYSFPKSILVATKEVYNESLLTFEALGIFAKKLILPEKKEDRKEALDSVSWPVWIVSVVHDASKAWFSFLLILASLISINLWIFNLLPIPALDWWRFLFFTINEIIYKTTWKKWISPFIEWIIHMSFFAILIFLSIIIAYNDVLKIFNN